MQPKSFLRFRRFQRCIASVACAVVFASLQTKASDSPATNEVHWALKTVTRPTPPPVTSKKFKPRNAIDNFIVAKLEGVKLSPSPEASRRVLIRRLYFDLIGLPPTPREVEAFEQDRAANAYDKVVDRLLGSRLYGERWAQHWLDVVRFAETHGFEMNQPRPTSWMYRDYVIRSFNEDKPYDRFVIEQLAGDLFGEDAATGFLVAGPWDQVKSPDPVLTAAQRADELHDMVSTVGSTFLGLTVGCARCHNHKFDPIPQTDYYAIKACLAGVQHGERKLRTPDLAIREQQLEESKARLAGVEETLTSYEPMASTGRRLLIEPDPAFGSRTLQLLRPAKTVSYPEGTARGQRDDPGSSDHLPNVSRSYLAWTNSRDAALCSYAPAVAGRFQLWLSWGCGSTNNAKDAQFVLDKDGDLSTTADQIELARVDQQLFADGSEPTTNRLWSGFHDAGAYDLTTASRVIFHGGQSDATATAGVLGLVEAPAAVAEAASTAPQFLRAPVNARRNVERFTPVSARWLRFTVGRTTDAEPCIDELQVFTVGSSPTNIALASLGTKAKASSVFPNSEIHRLEHINDGKFGNSRSWISDERGKGWVELEFPQEVVIDRVVWGRDREQQFSDRLATEFRIEVATRSNEWSLAASSADRVAFLASRPASAEFPTSGLAKEQADELRKLISERTRLEARVKELSAFPTVYAGRLVEQPEATYRLQRGDPMQKREQVEPGALSAIPIGLELEAARNQGAGGNGSVATGGEPKAMTDDQARRLALARWIVEPANPLPARVLVNRLWQHHFGEALVTTPSDFGRKGAEPSHPELLDWLAAEFMRPQTVGSAAPWSIKHIQRLIVTSATYRQASVLRPDAMALDAGSRLLWRFPAHRLDAEALHDTILTVSGKLVLTTGGAGFSAFEPNDNYVRVYNPKKEFGDAEWRRMIYMTKVRMHPDQTFGPFDCPDGGQITPKRMRSTTPLQALNLLNSEFMLQQAELFAGRIEELAGPKVPDQVRLAFDLAYNRLPDAQEQRAAKALIGKHGLKLFCRALLNSNEFLFVE